MTGYPQEESYAVGMQRKIKVRLPWPPRQHGLPMNPEFELDFVSHFVFFSSFWGIGGLVSLASAGFSDALLALLYILHTHPADDDQNRHTRSRSPSSCMTFNGRG
jgi:hypothetical protein